MNTLSIPPSRIALVKWHVDQKFWRPMSRPTDMICTVGREMRDFGTFIEAVKTLDIPCHIAAASLVGKNDPWRNDLKKAEGVYPNITIGPKSFVELRELYARSRFVVIPLMPTDTDNGITAILESMAMGKAVICSRVQGQVDVIQEGKTGIFVPPRNPAALREAIQYLWNHPEVAERMGAEGRKHIEQYFTLDDWVRQIRAVVEEVIATREPDRQKWVGIESEDIHASGASIPA